MNTVDCGKGFRITKDMDGKIIVTHVKYREYNTPIDIVTITGKIWCLKNDKLSGIDIPDDVLDNVKKANTSKLKVSAIFHCGDGFKIIKKNDKLFVAHTKYARYESDIDTVIATSRLWNIRPSIFSKSITRAYSIDVPKNILENIRKIKNNA